MTLLNYVFRKCTEVYKYRNSQEKINHFMYIGNKEVFTKNKNELEIW